MFTLSAVPHLAALVYTYAIKNSVHICLSPTHTIKITIFKITVSTTVPTSSFSMVQRS